MPIYSYVCKKCGEKFDFLVGVGTGSEVIKCKKCGSKKVERIVARFSVGSGKSRSSSPSSCPSGTCNLK